MDIRNIAIIAHVDHGKTTLVNALLKSSHAFREGEEIADRILDSNPLEHERGITILAKVASLFWKDTKINIVDTPGHADFGGEVERIMHMVDGCLLLVDALEGVMPQTRFVLKNALENHIKPLVVVNKVDRANADSKKAVDEVLDLLIELGAPEEYLDFPIVYCSALNDTCSLSPDVKTQEPGMSLLLDAIIREMPAPICDPSGDFQWQPALLDYSDFLGRIGIGTVRKGSVKTGDALWDIRKDNSKKSFKAMKLYTYSGMQKVEAKEVVCGDICALSGIDDLSVGDTVCKEGIDDPLPRLRIDEPTLQMEFGTNSSPLRGQEGKFVTARLIEERLRQEVERDVSLAYERIPNSETWIVSGRGELHLGILIENMRREGYEFEVGKPRAITKEIDGVMCEPYEDLRIDVPSEYTGTIMEILGSRGSELLDMDDNGISAHLTYVIPSRGLIGFSNNFLALTRGYGIMNHSFKEYRPLFGKTLGERNIGVLVSVDKGPATPYAIEKVEDHGTMFISPGETCYEGMIVGEHRYPNDLAVNCTALKPQTNIRSAHADMTVVLKAPRKMSLEQCLDYINFDELVEVTPEAIRMRKKILDTAERKKFDSKKRKEAEGN